MNYLKKGDGFWCENHDSEGNLVTIDDTLTSLATDTAANAAAIAVNTGDIATNTAAILVAMDMADTGYIGQARFTFGGVNAIAAETITIGAEIYEFDGVGANVNVPVGLDVEATIDNLVIAINTNTTEDIFAEKESPTVLVIWNADAPGGTPEVGTSICALAETVADPLNIWDQLNMATTGRVPFTHQVTGIMVADALNITAAFPVELPFSPVDVQWYVKDATGTTLCGCTATVTAVGPVLTFDLGAGIAGMAATDVMYWVARG